MESFFELKSDGLWAQSKEMTCSRIKRIRKSYKLTQESFAKLLNISYHTYKNWEIGHRHPCTSAIALLILAEQQPHTFLEKTTKLAILQKDVMP